MNKSLEQIENKLEVVYLPINSIIPYARNPRKNDKAVIKVASSLKEFGFRQPIVVDPDMVVVVGHTRLKAAEQLGFTDVPVHIARGLTEAQIKAYRIADNRTNEEAEWDFDLLRLEIEDLDGFDLSLLAFDGDELEEIIHESGNKAQADDVPEPPIHVRSNEGDIWILGDHILGNGSSLDEAFVRKVVTEPVDLVWTDPPYNIDYGSTTGRQGILNDKFVSNSHFYDFLNAYFKNVVGIMKPGACFYVAHATGLERVPFVNAIDNNGLKISTEIMWVKGHATFCRSDYNKIFEPILYGWKEGAAHYFCGDFTQTTMIRDQAKDLDLTKLTKQELVDMLQKTFDQSDIIRVKRPSKSELHPTMKPIELVQKQIENSSQFGWTVYDGFGGSGSTLIACEVSGRKCRTIELDTQYADVIIKRWQDYTGKTAYHAITGTPFNDYPTREYKRDGE